jgi:hypothetical protein
MLTNGVSLTYQAIIGRGTPWTTDKSKFHAFFMSNFKHCCPIKMAKRSLKYLKFS